MIASVADSKSDLRARIRAARSRPISEDDRARGRDGLLTTALAAGLLDRASTPDALGAVVIAAYIAAPGEPDVAAIRAAVREVGGTVLLPIPRADRTLDWALDDGDYRPEGRYPIEVPAGEVLGSGAPGLLAHGVRTVLVPALAVDLNGARLGQGGGYYDRLLADLAGPAGLLREGVSRIVAHQSAAGIRVIAVVRDEELLAAGAVPSEAHDQVMVAALTPTRYVPLGR
jgi:5-formyltetrahydrofolate cyclo-ligase